MLFRRLFIYTCTVAFGFTQGASAGCMSDCPPSAADWNQGTNGLSKAPQGVAQIGPAAGAQGGPALASTTGGAAGGADAAGKYKVVFSPTKTPFTFSATIASIKECQGFSTEIHVKSCESNAVQPAACSSLGTGGSDTGTFDAACMANNEAMVSASSAECKLKAEAAKASCEKTIATVESEEKTCIAAGKEAAATATDPASQAAALKFNVAGCQAVAKKSQAETKSLIAGITSKQVTHLALAAAAGAMLMKLFSNSKKSADDFSATATPTAVTPASTTTAKDESCKAGDYNCLCKGGRAERPVACDSSCAFSMGKPNSTCLAKRYGSDWESKYLDPTGQVITGSGNSEYQVTENSNNGQTAAAYTGGRSGSGTLRGGSAESAEMGKNDNGKSQVAGSGSGTDLSLSSAGGSSLNMSSPYASSLPNREMASTGSSAADAERAQIAAKSTNLFGNVTRVYRRYSVEMMN